MSNIQHAYLSSYRLPLEIVQVEDGSFMATSPALEGFLVLADTVEEVISLAPGIAKALIEALRELSFIKDRLISLLFLTI